ncbi:hypothetical protein V8C37DRAFT_414658 [Trichoderma ceciliae]
MDEPFCLVAPLARRVDSWNDVLGDIIFNGSAQGLVDLLAVPVEPKKISLGSRLVPSVPIKTLCLASGGLVHDELVLISNKQHAKRKASRVRDVDGDDKAGASRSLLFSELPYEIHRLIVSHLESEVMDDVVCLSLTNKYFWSVCMNFLCRYRRSFLGQWAGKNIVCVGKDVKPGDHPPGLFSADEEARLAGEKLAVPANFEGSGEEGRSDPYTLHTFTHPLVSDKRLEVKLAQRSSSAFLRSEKRCIGEDHRLLELKKDELLVDESRYFPTDQPWILRNLTTKEFVRSEDIALKPEFIRGPKIDVLGFGEVVLSRILWTTPSSDSTGDETISTRGVWAGHRFDITTLARHREDTRVVEWKDVSEDVATDIARIWESEYGPDWRETACQNYRDAEI